MTELITIALAVLAVGAAYFIGGRRGYNLGYETGSKAYEEECKKAYDTGWNDGATSAHNTWRGIVHRRRINREIYPL